MNLLELKNIVESSDIKGTEKATIWFNDTSFEVTFDYTVFGSYEPQTGRMPEQQPEIEVTNMLVQNKNGKYIPIEKYDRRMYKGIEREAEEQIKDEINDHLRKRR